MTQKYIELNIFLKKHNLATTGGQAKLLIRSGKVFVNKEVEKRNRRKLHVGDLVEFERRKFTVSEEFVR